MKRAHRYLMAGLTSLLAATTASAAIYIDTVLVGDTGNADDSTGFGGVGYSYHIGTYEVTNSQYTAFLNAVAAADTHGLYNTKMSSSNHGGIMRSGSSGTFTYSTKSGFANKPVNFVSFWDATRFTNWMTSGDTETGVYVLTSTGISSNTITRDASAFNSGGVAIAGADEWYKAAHYDGSSGYFDYPTQSNSISGAAANYGGSVGTVTDVGTYVAYDSHYGTFDQGGNVFEWNDTIVSTNMRGSRGGAFGAKDFEVKSSFSLNLNPTQEFDFVGFRTSSLTPIPEPSTYASILGGLGLGLALMRRQRRRWIIDSPHSACCSDVTPVTPAAQYKVLTKLQ